MNRAEAEAAIGKLVMSYDAGAKMIHSVLEAHGPYKLLQVTKGGMCILEGRNEKVPPSLIYLFTFN